MDANRFDALAKGMATSTSRRTMLGALAAGGVLSALGLKHTSIAATGQTCVLDFTAIVRLGPSAGQVLGNGSTQPGQLRGELRIPMTEDEDFANGMFSLPDGQELPVVGRVTGRTLKLRIAADNGFLLVALGLAQENVASCRGTFDGLATGSQAGDLGDWHATALELVGESGGGGNSSGGSGSGLRATLTAVAATKTATAEATTTATVTPTATTAPTVPPEGCQAGRTACSGFCVDLQSDVKNCGACGNECRSNQGCTGGMCSDYFTGQCRAGWTPCGGRCVDTFSDPTNCGACGNVCGPNQGCTDGGCSDFIGSLCRAGYTYCNGRCVDLFSDASHCGSCGRACGSNQGCTDGQCSDFIPDGGLNRRTCFAGLTDCGGTCVDLNNDNNNCGACGNACPIRTYCGGSGRCLCGSSGCCVPIGGACNRDADCCYLPCVLGACLG